MARMNARADERAAHAKKWKPNIAAARMLQHASDLIKAGEWSKAHSLATRAFDFNCVAGEAAYQQVVNSIMKPPGAAWLSEDARTLREEMDAAAELAIAATKKAGAK